METFTPLWEFCDNGDNNELTGEELYACGNNIAAYLEIPDGKKFRSWVKIQWKNTIKINNVAEKM